MNAERILVEIGRALRLVEDELRTALTTKQSGKGSRMDPNEVTPTEHDTPAPEAATPDTPAEHDTPAPEAATPDTPAEHDTPAPEAATADTAAYCPTCGRPYTGDDAAASPEEAPVDAAGNPTR